MPELYRCLDLDRNQRKQRIAPPALQTRLCQNQLGTTMFTIYLASAGFGVALIAASVFLGGDDMDLEADSDVDFDADVDIDADGDLGLDGDAPGSLELSTVENADGVHSSGILVPFLSMRFWTYGLGSFGGTGAVLHSLGQPLLVHLSAAGGLGLVLGYTAAWGFRALQGAVVDSTSHASKLSGLEADVLLPLGPARRGKIRVQAPGQTLDLPADTREDRMLAPGERVLIIAARNGIATVESISPGNHHHENTS